MRSSAAKSNALGRSAGNTSDSAKESTTGVLAVAVAVAVAGGTEAAAAAEADPWEVALVLSGGITACGNAETMK